VAPGIRLRGRERHLFGRVPRRRVLAQYRSTTVSMRAVVAGIGERIDNIHTRKERP
jgi:hypothetical protein